jgi:predicted neutral ceramidase superfamily lipid hydrolase
LLTVFIGSSASAEFKAGAAKKSIQPKLPVPISGGMGAPKMASEASGELTARAIAVADGDTRVAVCCLDLLGFPAVLCQRVRQQVKGIPAENILIASTHTHSGPDAYAFPDGKGGHTGDLKYIDFVVQQAAAAIQAAVDSLQPASLTWSITQCIPKCSATKWISLAQIWWAHSAKSWKRTVEGWGFS